jgi:hypothetical protein
LPQRRAIKKMANPRPAENGLPFSTWSLTKLADFLVAEGVVDDISHEGLRQLLRAENVSFKRIGPGSSPATRTTRSIRRDGLGLLSWGSLASCACPCWLTFCRSF